MEKKILLFEIEKGELPTLTWTEEDATKNIWSTPYTLQSGATDVNSLNDSAQNGYSKVETEVQLSKNMFDINLDKKYSFDIPDANDTVNEVGAYLRGQTYSSGSQPWTVSGSNGNVVFTSTLPVIGGVLGYNLSTNCKAGNIDSSISTTTAGVRGESVSKEIIEIRLPVTVTQKWYDDFYAPWTAWTQTCGYPVYQSGVQYHIGDKVLDGGDGTNDPYYSYICIQDAYNKSPPNNISWWERTHEEPICHTEITLIIRDQIVVFPICNATNGNSSEDYYIQHANVSGNIQYNYNEHIRNFIYWAVSMPRAENPIIPGQRDNTYYYFKFLQRYYPENYWIINNSIYSENAIKFSNDLADLISSSPDPFSKYSMLSNTNENLFTLTSYANIASTGILGFVDSGGSGLTATVICTQEGGSVDTSIVHEVETLVVNSVNDEYRLFYYDKPTSTLYLRLEYGLDPNDLDFNTAVKKGFSNFEGYYNPLEIESPLFYEGRLQSIPNISFKKDSTYYSVVSFDGGAITLNNTDGYFDNLDEEDVYGQICTLWYSMDSGSTFQKIYTGYFESFQLNGIPGQCVINVYDKRKILSKSIPPNSYSLTDYPNLNINNVGLPKAMGFGKINSAPAVCLNEAEVTPTNYTFLICDPIHPIESIDEVTLDGVIVTPENINLTACTFTLPFATYKQGKQPSVSYHGYIVDAELLENPIKILEYLLSNYAGLSKTAFNYNLTEWNSCRDRVGNPIIGMHIADKKTMIDIIGDISNSIFGTFLIQKDGLISFKIRDPNKAISKIIYMDDQIASPIQNYISSEYANAIRVGYNKAYSNGRSTHIRFDDQETSLFNRYRVDSEKTVETYISNEADATTYGDSLYLQYAGVFPTFTIRTKSSFMNLELEDIIEVETYITDQGPGFVVLEVLGVDFDLNLNECTIVGRFIRNKATYTNKKLIKRKGV